MLLVFLSYTLIINSYVWIHRIIMQYDDEVQRLAQNVLSPSLQFYQMLNRAVLKAVCSQCQRPFIYLC